MSEIIRLANLYKRDSKGALRKWGIEQREHQYRTVSGAEGATLVRSEWTDAQTTNAGRANERGPKEQADFEIAAAYKKKRDEGYCDTVDAALVSTFREPMLAEKYAPKHVTFPVYSQPKLDGIRCLARKDGLWSRNGKPIVSCPHIMEALHNVFVDYPNLVIDGELYNHDLKAEFEQIVSLTKKQKPTDADLAKSKALIQYHVFDIQSADEYTARWMFIDEKLFDFSEMFIDEKLFDFSEDEEDNGGYGLPSCIQRVYSAYCPDQEHLDLVYRNYLGEGYEGQMIRNPKSQYEFKRTKNLLKRKEFLDQEFIIHDIVEGVGNRSGMAGRIEYKTKDGKVFGSGIRGGVEHNRMLLEQRASYIGGTGTVRFQNWTEDGVPRFPVTVSVWAKGAQRL